MVGIAGSHYLLLTKRTSLLSLADICKIKLKTVNNLKILNIVKTVQTDDMVSQWNKKSQMQILAVLLLQLRLREI